MGRGRAKAKQARIARELKYFSPPTDLTALQHELGGAADPADEDVYDDWTPAETDGWAPSPRSTRQA